MLNKVFKSVSNGEIIKVIEFDDKSRQCIVELENGKTKAYSSATLKDKRKFTLISEELSDEEYAEIGKEIAEQAKAKAEKKTTLVEDLMEAGLIAPKEEVSDSQAKAKKSGRKSLRLKEVTYKGETKSIREWAEETEIPWKTLYNRINNNGWPIDLALETPIGERKPKNKEA